MKLFDILKINMSEGSDVSSFESFESESEQSESSKSSSSESSEDENTPNINSVKTSVSKNKTPRNSKKQKIIFPPGVGEKDERISPKRMNRYEFAALVGEFAEMISKGAKIHPKYSNVETMDLCEIARLHLEDRTIPFPILLKRPIDANTIEVFNVREPGFTLPSEALTNHIEKYTPVNTRSVCYSDNGKIVRKIPVADLM